MSFWDFMCAEELPDVYRPDIGGLKLSTAKGYWRYVHQMGEDIGFPEREWFDKRDVPFQLLHGWAGNAVERARRRGHQRALWWLCAYKGYRRGDLPPFLSSSWNNARHVHRAVAAGLIRQRDRHLTVEEYRTLLASHPFEDHLRRGERWNDRKQRANAIFKDDVFRFMVGFAPYVAARPSEWTALRVEDLDVEERRVIRWAQEKKDGKGRSFTLPEAMPWVAEKRAYPSLQWYLREVRPGARAQGKLVLQQDGSAYKDPAETVLRRGMRLVLGNRAPNAHAFRRLGATEAWAAGWSEDAICRLLDDEWKNVKASYIDWDRVGDLDRPRSRSERPPRTVYRSNGRRTLHELTAAETRPVPAASSESLSGFVRI